MREFSYKKKDNKNGKNNKKNNFDTMKIKIFDTV